MCSSKHITLLDLHTGITRYQIEHSDYRPLQQNAALNIDNSIDRQTDMTPTRGNKTGQIFGFRNFCFHRDTSTLAVLFGSCATKKNKSSCDRLEGREPRSLRKNMSRIIHIYDVDNGRLLKQLELHGLHTNNMKMAGRCYQTFDLVQSNHSEMSVQTIRDLVLVCRTSDPSLYDNSSVVCIRMHSIIGQEDVGMEGQRHVSNDYEIVRLEDSADIVSYEIGEEYIVGLQKSISGNYGICIWDSHSGSKLLTLEQALQWKRSENINEHMFVIRCSNVAYMVENGDIHTYDLCDLRLHQHTDSSGGQFQQPKCTVIQTNRHHFTGVRLYDWISNDRLITLSNDILQVWKVTTGQILLQERTINNFFTHGELKGVWISGDLLLVAADGTFFMWNLSNGCLVNQLNVGGPSVMSRITSEFNSVAFDQRTITCAEGSRIGIWKIEDRKHASMVTSGRLASVPYTQILSLLHTGDIVQFSSPHTTHYGMVFKLRGKRDTKLWLDPALLHGPRFSALSTRQPSSPLSPPIVSHECPDALLTSAMPFISRYLSAQHGDHNCTIVVHRLKRQLSSVQLSELERFIAVRKRQIGKTVQSDAIRRSKLLLHLFPIHSKHNPIPREQQQQQLGELFRGSTLVAQSLFHVLRGGPQLRFHDVFKSPSIMLTF